MEGFNQSSINHNVTANWVNSNHSKFTMNCLYVDFSRSAIDKFYITYILSIVLNSVCALPASILNILVILAVWRKSQLHNPSNLLLSNLALTDFGVGCLVQPVFAAHKIAALHENIPVHCIASLASKTLASLLCAVSLLTLTAISIDRLLALALSVRYRTVVTIPITTRVVVLLWLVGILVTIPLFVYPMSFLYCMILVMVICLTVTIIAYTKLLHLIHRHKTKVGVDTRQTTRQQSQETAEMANIAKYKTSIRTVIYLVIIMVLFYSPYLVTNIVLVAVESRNDDRFKAALHYSQHFVHEFDRESRFLLLEDKKHPKRRHRDAPWKIPGIKLKKALKVVFAWRNKEQWRVQRKDCRPRVFISTRDTLSFTSRLVNLTG